jgi:hypothetical protein
MRKTIIGTGGMVLLQILKDNMLQRRRSPC